VRIVDFLPSEIAGRHHCRHTFGITPLPKAARPRKKGIPLAVGSHKKKKKRQWSLSWRSALAVLVNVLLGVGINVATQTIRLSPWLAPWSWAALIILAAVFVVIDHHNQKPDQISNDGTVSSGGSARRNPAVGMYVVLIIVVAELAVVIIAVVAMFSTAVTSAAPWSPPPTPTPTITAPPTTTTTTRIPTSIVPPTTVHPETSDPRSSEVPLAQPLPPPPPPTTRACPEREQYRVNMKGQLVDKNNEFVGDIYAGDIFVRLNPPAGFDPELNDRYFGTSKGMQGFALIRKLDYEGRITNCQKS
jgi:hypothetical protein